MLRRPIFVAAALSTSIYAQRPHKNSHCNAPTAPTNQSWLFDPKGMSTVLNPSFYPPNNRLPTPLYLAGVGMRRKNLYVVEVDVYMIGLNISEPALNNANKWKIDNNGESLTDALLKGEGQLRVSCTLKFQREIGNASFVEAFTSAFAGCKDVDAVTKFKKVLGECVGAGVKKDDELVFYWLGSTDIAISKNGSVPTICSLQSKEVVGRLLDVYIDPSRAVSKELSTCVADHLLTLKSRI
jgi:hypothetical protein